MDGVAEASAIPANLAFYFFYVFSFFQHPRTYMRTFLLNSICMASVNSHIHPYTELSRKGLKKDEQFL